MKIFELENPVMRKIESVVNQAKTDNRIPSGSLIKFFDFEPDEGFIRDVDADGAVAVYAPNAEILEAESSTTGDQVLNEFLRIDCYGFGDPVPEGDGQTEWFPTVREAQNRAQNLLYYSYNAVMDRQEVAGSTDVPKGFDAPVDFGADKYPIGWQKFAPIGTINSRRGVVVYRLTIRFKFDEPAKTEPLGVPFQGSDDVDSQTYNPGAQPE